MVKKGLIRRLLTAFLACDAPPPTGAARKRDLLRPALKRRADALAGGDPIAAAVSARTRSRPAPAGVA
ncbi:MAG: hypothetical protein ED558_16340 [Oricola sp.]|nr:MAG: hypothetical protein ED558_16340 [Oricola sp.]